MPLSRRHFARLLSLLPLTAVGCAADTRVAADADGPFHHTADGFRNPPGSPVRGGSFGDWTAFFYRGLTHSADVPLPAGHVLEPGAARAGLEAQSGDSLTWLGHACFLIRLAGQTILTDPYLSPRASPFSFFGPERFVPPGLPTAALPPIDLLLLSHNHYDHLDLPTLAALPDRERIPAIMPLGVSRYLDGHRFARLDEVDWHEQRTVGPLRITAIPAIHFSKRTLFDRNATLWAGFVIEGGGRRILFTGDTAYGPVFADEIGPRYRPFDLALVPIGAYAPRELMIASHATPEEAVRIGLDVGAPRLAAMHWGTIRLTDEPPFEPPERFVAAARAAGYAEADRWVMAIGETRPL